MLAYTEATGWGLAGVWGHVHRSQYQEARARFNQLRDVQISPARETHAAITSTQETP
ncbi:hypothetical protein [Intrasporangium chromatireducens]|uniref:hypothetical protein n=1 Tax=Intrasporangium chromatireducens TaxID=1386088 RepID=UPI0004B7EDFA|nr:hypothetical protein [Intrasporangium chromatireducens]